MKIIFRSGLLIAFGLLAAPAAGQNVFPGGPQFNRNSHDLPLSGASLNQSNLAPGLNVEQPGNQDYGIRLEALEQAFADRAEADKKAASKLPSMRISGRIHLDVWDFAHASPGIGFFENPMTGVDPESRIAFRRIRFTFRGDITETIHYRYDLEFASPQNPQYRDVYIGFSDLPLLQTVRIGNQKRPQGLDHLNSSNDNVFLERPMVIDAFNEDARRIGIASYGVSDDEVYNWRFGAYNLDNTQATGAYIGDSYQMSGNVRLASTPWYDDCSDGRGYFHWGISGMFARPDGDDTSLDSNSNEAFFRTRPEARSTMRWLDTGAIAGAKRYEVLGLESLLNVGPLQIVSEYQGNWVQRSDNTEVFLHGSYVYVAYTLTGEHIPFDRRTGTIGHLQPFENFFFVNRCTGGHGGGWGAWQAGVRYSHLDLTDDNIAGGEGESVTVALNWIWSKKRQVAIQLRARRDRPARSRGRFHRR